VSQERARDALDLVAVTAHQGACHATQSVPTAGPFRTVRARINLGHELVDIVEVEAVIAAARPKAFEFRLAAGHAHHDIRAVGAWEAAQHKLFITALGYWPVPMLNGLGKVRLGASVGLKHMIGGNRGGAPEQAEHPGNDGMPAS
jgi:hypothetical protein